MRIDATYRVTTPLFCAGAVPSCAELRLPSFKGALRFWWRALAWPRCGGDLEAIRQQEDALFGSAGGGQSRVLMRLAPDRQHTEDRRGRGAHGITHERGAPSEKVHAISATGSWRHSQAKPKKQRLASLHAPAFVHHLISLSNYEDAIWMSHICHRSRVP